MRWQGLHPAAQRSGPDGLTHVLTRLQALPLPAELWEQTVLPNRVRDYQPRWLDELTAAGEWSWICQNASDDGPGLLAFVGREHLRQMTPPNIKRTADNNLPSLADASGQCDIGPKRQRGMASLAARLTETPALDAQAEQVLGYLKSRGASFLTDVAQDTHLSPSTVRTALWSLLRHGLVTNDHFDVIRRGEEREKPSREGELSRLTSRTLRPTFRVSGRTGQRPEGRWSLVPWGNALPEAQAVLQASLLLQRYGIVSRELAQMDHWLLPWRVLYDVLSRMELAGGVRRGYFVEGMSGSQFALPEAARMLQQLDIPPSGQAPTILVHSLDPANLYGSGAPFDIPLLDGGTRPLTRRSGNWLVIRAGLPVLLIEQQGKRLSALASASREDIKAAVRCLPGILERSQSLSARHKLTVDEWNGKPVTTTDGKELLEAAGFVRDYQSLTLYANRT